MALFLPLILGVFMAGCQTDTPSPDTPMPELQRSPLVAERGGTTVSVLPTATRFSPTETPVPVTEPPPLELVLLHTNDNWGETEPCG